jgi:hypothetical protein
MVQLRKKEQNSVGLDKVVGEADCAKVDDPKCLNEIHENHVTIDLTREVDLDV